MPRFGNKKTEILFIGSNPNQSEDLINSSVIGDEKELIDSIIKKAGIDVETCGFVYGVLCHSSESAKAFATNCFSNLSEVVNRTNPVGLVFIGSEARQWYKTKFRGIPSAFITSPAALVMAGGRSAPMYFENVNRLSELKRTGGF